MAENSETNATTTANATTTDNAVSNASVEQQNVNTGLEDVFVNVEQPVEQPTKQTVEQPVEQKTVAPESYDLKLANGSDLDPVDYERVSAIFKDANVSQEQAQKILSAYENEVTNFSGQIQQQIQQQKESWVNAVQNDPELGGQNFEKTKSNLRAVVQKFGNQELANFLNNSSLGYNPDFVRFANSIGKALNAEQKFVNQNNPPITTERERYQKMYPNSPELWKNL